VFTVLCSDEKIAATVNSGGTCAASSVEENSGLEFVSVENITSCAQINEGDLLQQNSTH